jgi:hypothetical protein
MVRGRVPRAEREGRIGHPPSRPDRHRAPVGPNVTSELVTFGPVEHRPAIGTLRT